MKITIQTNIEDKWECPCAKSFEELSAIVHDVGQELLFVGRHYSEHGNRVMSKYVFSVRENQEILAEVTVEK